MTITENQVARAKELRAKGLSWREVGKRVGASNVGIRRRVDDDFRARKNELSNRPEYRRGKYCGSTGVSADVQRWRVPEHVVDELIRATCAPRTITAEVCGDPLPGRSALDKMRGAQR